MFQTSLFAEEYPANISSALLSLCQIIYVMAIVSALILAGLLIFQTLKSIIHKINFEDNLFVLVSYILLLISFAGFVIVYPYTCSSDFRYITIALVFMSMTIASANKKPEVQNSRSKFLSFLINTANFLIVSTLTLLMVVYYCWNLI